MNKKIIIFIIILSIIFVSVYTFILFSVLNILHEYQNEEREINMYFNEELNWIYFISYGGASFYDIKLTLTNNNNISIDINLLNQDFPIYIENFTYTINQSNNTMRIQFDNNNPFPLIPIDFHYQRAKDRLFLYDGFFLIIDYEEDKLNFYYDYPTTNADCQWIDDGNICKISLVNNYMDLPIMNLSIISFDRYSNEDEMINIRITNEVKSIWEYQKQLNLIIENNNAFIIIIFNEMIIRYYFI